MGAVAPETATAAHHGHVGRRVYLLTTGLEHSMRMLGRGTGLNVPGLNDPIFSEVNGRLCAALKSAVGGVEVQSIDALKLGDQVFIRAQRLGDGYHVVSTCPEIVLPNPEHNLRLNRLIDLDGQVIGIGPRPGMPSLRIQVRNAVVSAAGRPIVIAEDGIFSGGTICSLVRMIRQAGGVVVAVVAGFCFAQASQQLSQLDPPVEVITVTDYHPGQMEEWMPDHDFIPLMPNCGRVLGVSVGNEHLPYYSQNNVCYAAPYLMGFCNIKDWASIPSSAAADFSRQCLDLAQKLFQRVAELNGGPLMVRQLMSQNNDPRIAMPFSCGRYEDVLGPPLNAVVDRGRRRDQTVYSFIETLRERYEGSRR